MLNNYKWQPAAKDPVRLQNIGSASQMCELQRDFAFFSLALPYLCLPLGSHLYADFAQQTSTSADLAVLKFTHALFSGLDHSDFAHGLFGLPREVWERFKEWTKALSFVDPREEAWRPGGVRKQSPPLLARARWQSVRILDPIVASQRRLWLSADAPPTAPVWALALEYVDGAVYFSKALPPRAVFDKGLTFEDTTDLGGVEFSSLRTDL